MIQLNAIQTPVKKIAILGLGGVGGYLTARLLQEFNTDPAFHLTAVARGETLRTLKENGLALLSNDEYTGSLKPNQLVGSIDELEAPGIIFICVKGYDLENVCQQLKDVTTDETMIVPLMNGVDLADRIRYHIKKGIIIPSCLYVASHVKERGVIEHRGKEARIVLGFDELIPQAGPEPIAQLLAQAGMQVEVKQEAETDIWKKFFFICSFGLVTARYNASFGEVLENEQFSERARCIMKEVIAVAESRGVSLPGGSIDEAFEQAGKFPYQTPSSLQLDIHQQKEKSELHLLTDPIINWGEQNGQSVNEVRKIRDEILAIKRDSNNKIQ